MSKSILVVAAHADDEVLGCGGTIAKHVSQGDKVTIVFMTDGVSSRSTQSEKEVVKRESALKNALNMLGVKSFFCHSFPDNKMDSVPLLDVVKVVETAIKKSHAEVVYTHFSGDLNIDHQITHRAVMTACRPQSWSLVKEIYSFEVLSATEWNSPSESLFVPTKIINITDFWEKKLSALICYEEEMRDFPHSRSYQCVEALAILRGATHGYDKAEAFYIERILCD